MTFDERIYNKAIVDGMPPILATFIVAQCKGESTNYTSHVFTSCNNLNGYKWVGQSTALGPCLISPEGDYYAKYATIEDSVHELTMWIKRRQAAGFFPANLATITTPEQYAGYLIADPNHRYYGSSLSSYTAMIITRLKELGNLVVTPESGAVLLVLVALGIIIWRKRIFP